jgi:hypothetical protein
MSQSGYTPIQLYRTTTAAAVPTAGNLAAGELAINLTDERLYFKNAAGVVKLLASNTGALGTVTSVNGSGGTTGLTLTGGPITSSGTLTLGGTLGVANGGTGTGTAFTAGSVVFAGASGVYSQDNANLFWDNSNDRLGIGTAAPDVTLHAQSATGQIRVQNTTSGTALIGFRNSSTTDVPWVGTGGDDIRITTQSAERMRIASGGDVGIGTSTPAYKLDVNGTFRTTGIAYLGDATTTLIASIGNSASTGVKIIQFSRASGTGDNVNIQGINTGVGAADFGMQVNGGNVGIGTASPQLKFVVSNAGAAGLEIDPIAVASAPIIQSYNRSGAAYTQLTYSALHHVFQISGTEQMRISSAGNVGIGASTPASTLAVNTASGVAPANTSGANALRLTSTTTAAVGVGPSILFEGQTGNSTANFGFAGIQGLKTSATANDYSGALAFFTQNSGGASALSEHMRITSAGNVGIGTATPTVKLDVNGSIGVQAVGSAVLFDTTGAAQANYISTVDNFSLRMICGRGTTSSFTAGPGAATIETNSTERMRVDTSGNVMIGTTAANNKFLVTYANPVTVPAAGAGGHCTAFGTVGYGLATGALTNGNAYLQATRWDALATNYDLLLQPNGGNVLVGTTTANGILSVVGNQISVGNGSGSGSLGIQIKGTALSAIPAAQVQSYIATGDSSMGVAGDLLIASRTDVAANIRFITGTTPAERMRIDASGNVGIGTSSPAARLDLGAYTGPALGTTMMAMQDGWLDIKTSSIVVGSRYLYGSTVYGRAFANVTGFNLDTGSAAVPLVFGTNNTERMRIDSSGNVGIGTSSPATKLEVSANTGTETFKITQTDATGGTVARMRLSHGSGTQAVFEVGAGYGALGLTTSGPLAFSTNNTERARIDSSGNLLWGKTSLSNETTTDGAILYKNASGGGAVAYFTNGGTGTAMALSVQADANAIQFFRSGTLVGSISLTSTNTAYNTSSDARLKENITNADSASVLIDAIKVRQFDWKSSGLHQRYGFVAQELLDVAPEAVNQPADPDEMMGVDYSKLVPMLVKEIQSLRARVAQLEERK